MFDDVFTVLVSVPVGVRVHSALYGAIYRGLAVPQLPHVVIQRLEKGVDVLRLGDEAGGCKSYNNDINSNYIVHCL